MPLDSLSASASEAVKGKGMAGVGGGGGGGGGGMPAQRWLGALIRLCLACMGAGPAQLKALQSRFGGSFSLHTHTHTHTHTHAHTHTHTHYQDKLQTQAGATWLRPLSRVCVLLVCILWLVGDEEERQVELAEALAAVALPHATKQAARVNATSTTVGATYDPKFGDVGAHAARLLALRLLSLPVRRPRSFRTFLQASKEREREGERETERERAYPPTHSRPAVRLAGCRFVWQVCGPQLTPPTLSAAVAALRDASVEGASSVRIGIVGVAGLFGLASQVATHTHTHTLPTQSRRKVNRRFR